MKRIETAIPGVCLLEPEVFTDSRGFFFESYNQREFNEVGISSCFVQDNHSRSLKGTLRGLHYQINHPQEKLCRVIRGEVLDVAVDIRKGSPYFGKYVSAVISAENRLQIYIPKGFAHGYLVLSNVTEFLYKCSDFYYPEDDRGIAWNDPEIGIPWNIESPMLSRKDLGRPRLSQAPLSDLPTYDEGDL
jgi:dTDP-4-dehydrorhamnose 3,5-epimerase